MDWRNYLWACFYHVQNKTGKKRVAELFLQLVRLEMQVSLNGWKKKKFLFAYFTFEKIIGKI